MQFEGCARARIFLLREDSSKVLMHALVSEYKTKKTCIYPSSENRALLAKLTVSSLLKLILCWKFSNNNKGPVRWSPRVDDITKG